MKNITDYRIQAERDVRDDLKKPLKKLLAEMFEESQNPERTVAENAIHAQKRFATFEYKSHRANIRVGYLTLVVAFLALLVGLANSAAYLHPSASSANEALGNISTSPGPELREPKR